MTRTKAAIANFGLSFLLNVAAQDAQVQAAASNPAGETAASKPTAGKPGALPMEKYVSKDAIFLLYKPQGWQVVEGTRSGYRTIAVGDPKGLHEAALFYGNSSTGDDVLALTGQFISGIVKAFPDFKLRGAMISQDRRRVVYDAAYTLPGKGLRDFRCWISVARGEFMYASIDTPQGEFADTKQLLLTILANVRIFKGAFATGEAASQVRLVSYRLSDGSAQFDMPQDWQCREFGKGNFLAGDNDGGYAFLVASVDLITPKLGVTVPGVPVSDYLRPSEALPFLSSSQGAASNFRMENVINRQDVANAMASVYTGGPVVVEEFIYTCDTKAGRCRGYTFGFSFGARLGTNWNFRHMTVMAPADRFTAFAGTFANMLQSYQVDNDWARNYVAQGMARLRQLQRQTADMVSRNAREIRDMMQAAYDERQRSMDYIDYQRTSYIRGEQDWISSMEGGTVYHSDSWGTRNTATGETWNGSPYDYVHYNGANPKYSESMTPINSRALFERYVR